MKKQLIINEIMKSSGLNYHDAEILFREEICEKYGTENYKLAEAMFYEEK